MFDIIPGRYTAGRTIQLCLILCVIGMLSFLPMPTAAADEIEVRGRVEDPEGQSVGSVVVSVTGADGFQTQVECDARGRFRLTLPSAAAAYDFRLERDGYRVLQRTVRPTAIDDRDRLDLDFTLQLQRRLTRGRPLLDTAGRRIWPNSAWEAYRRGFSANEAGDQETARQEFDDALQIEPRFPPANAAVAISRHDDGRYREALVATQTYFAYRDDGTSSTEMEIEMLHVQADAAFALGDCATALASANTVLQVQPQAFSALRIQYLCYQNQGKDAEARAAKEALKNSDSTLGAAIEIHNAAVARFQAGHYRQAARDFETALELDPELIPSWSGLAKSHALGHQHAEALGAAEQLLQRAPEDVPGWNIRCDALVALEHDEADIRACLLRLVELDPDNKDHAHRLHQAAFRASTNGDVDTGVEFFRRALAVDSELMVSHRSLATLLLQQERDDEAAEAVEALLRVAPEDAQGLRLQERIRGRQQERLRE